MSKIFILTITSLFSFLPLNSLVQLETSNSSETREIYPLEDEIVNYIFIRVRWAPYTTPSEKTAVRNELHANYGKHPLENIHSDGSMTWRFDLDAINPASLPPGANGNNEAKTTIIQSKLEDLEEVIPD